MFAGFQHVIVRDIAYLKNKILGAEATPTEVLKLISGELQSPIHNLFILVTVDR